jgi:hypothetical protein
LQYRTEEIDSGRKELIQFRQVSVIEIFQPIFAADHPYQDKDRCQSDSCPKPLAADS